MTIPVFTNAPTKYLAINAQLNKAPVYIVSFGPVTGPLGTNYQPLADQYCTGYVQNPTVTRKRIMAFPTGFSSEFNPITYQSTLSTCSFDIQDNNPQYPGEAARLITNYILKNRWVTIKRGFQGIDESDYNIVYMGQINNVKLNGSMTGYTFELFDPRKQLTSTVLSGHSALTGPYTAGVSTTIAVANGTYFSGTGTTPSNPASTVRCYLRMGSNLFTYNGIAAAGLITDGTVSWQFVSAGGFTQPNPLLTPHLVTTPTNNYSANGQNWNAKDNFCGPTVPYASTGITVGAFFDSGSGAYFTWNGFDTSSYCQWVGGTSITIGKVCSNLGNRYVCVTPGITANSGGPTGNGSSGTVFSSVVLATPDGQGVSPATSQTTGANVDNVLQINGHPIDIILGLLMSTGTGLNNPTNSPAPPGITTYPTAGLSNYDINPGNSGAPGCVFGIGLPWWQINIPNFLAQKALMGPMNFIGYFQDEELGLKFIENYILAQAQICVFTNRQGQVDCKAVFPLSDMTGAITLDQSNIVGQPKFDNNLQSGGYFYNEPFISYDYQLVQGFYETIDITPFTPSLAAYQELAQIQVDGRFFSTAASNYGGAALSARCKNTYLARFAQPPPLIVCDVLDMMTLLNPFDLVILNHPTIPNYLTGSKGGPIDCQVVKVNPDWSSGKMQVTLMAIGWYQKQSHPSPSVIFSTNYTISSNQTAQSGVTIYPGVLVTKNAGVLLTVTP